MVPLRSSLRELQLRTDLRMDVFCYWRSMHGHGGPMLDAKHMSALADLNLQIGFDCY